LLNERSSSGRAGRLASGHQLQEIHRLDGGGGPVVVAVSRGPAAVVSLIRQQLRKRGLEQLGGRPAWSASRAISVTSKASTLSSARASFRKRARPSKISRAIALGVSIRPNTISDTQ
jgi:hypothetical protein